MTIAIILLAGFATVLLGRWMFGRWFNHLGIYGFAWGFSLSLFNAGLITYYPLQTETWMIIASGWISFVLGASTIVAMRYSMGNDQRDNTKNKYVVPDLQIFKKILWTINIIILVQAIHHAFIISNLIGGLHNFTKVGNIIYQLRVKGEIHGVLPYLSSLTFAACLIAGVYNSYNGKLQIITILPLMILLVDSFLNMTRNTLIIGGILYACGYTLNEKRFHETRFNTGRNDIKRYFSIALVLVLLLSGIEFVRSQRAIIEKYSSATSALARLQGSSYITPSIIFYITGNFGVLNQYLNKNSEYMIIGGYSLAPFWHAISKLGYPEYSIPIPPFYKTPLPGNNGTYLRELHADFGLVGIIAGPYLLGIIASWYWFRAFRSQKLIDIMILGHILIIVGMSVFLIATQWGYWPASLFFGIPLALLIDYLYVKKSSERNHNRPTVI
jgi:oligosaccharide repeat unit polymerase